MVYRPPSLTVGAGASRGVTAAEAGKLMDQALASAGLSPRAVRWLATVDAKAREPGLIAAAAERGWAVRTATAGELAAVDVPTPSEAVRAAVGTPSVAEAAALLFAAAGRELPGAAELLVPKKISQNATAAVARGRPRGRLALVGIGPGARDLLAPRAVAELRRASVIVGLDQYVRQVRDLLPDGTRILSSGLGDEEQRAAAAVSEALAGRAVALIGSGDAGIYAMASPALELADDRTRRGRRARGHRGAGRRGRCSVRHLATTMPRSRCPTCTRRGTRSSGGCAPRPRRIWWSACYNPASQARTWQLPRALAILAEHRPAGTPVGWVRDASRGRASGPASPPWRISTRRWPTCYTMVVIGSSRTRIVAGRMVTPRDYRWSAP